MLLCDVTKGFFAHHTNAQTLELIDINESNNPDQAAVSASEWFRQELHPAHVPSGKLFQTSGLITRTTELARNGNW